MHQLDRNRPGDGIFGCRPAGTVRAGQVGGGQGQSRPEPLAAGVDEVAGHLGEELVVCLHRPSEGALDPLQIAFQAGQAQEGSQAGHPRTIFHPGNSPVVRAV